MSYLCVKTRSQFLLAFFQATSRAGKTKEWPGQSQSNGEMLLVIITRINEETARQMGVHYLSN